MVSRMRKDGGTSVPPSRSAPTMPPPAPARTRPIEGFAKAVGKCTTEATIYGQCIFADYNNIYKDKCSKDFLRLKECVMKHSKR
ncbi:hypothetical protein EDC01DRAFT_650731 [Geopyxis carbonaria]|nr:hypothetical protein EDC01DRAFT_650731 [Geopyxis carbonaria]